MGRNSLKRDILRLVAIHVSRMLLAVFLVLSSLGNAGYSAVLVSRQMIEEEKRLTTQHTLKNGLPVIIRQIPGVELSHVHISFRHGLRDLPPGRKALAEWYWPASTMGTVTYPRQKMQTMMERYGLLINCGAGVEQSFCSLDTVNESWGQGLALLSAIVNRPAFDPAQADLAKSRVEAELRMIPGSPDHYANEIVNQAFYPEDHPYRLNHDTALTELKALKVSDLKAMHRDVLNAKAMAIVVVTSQKPAVVLKALEKQFGGIVAKPKSSVAVTPPIFRKDTAYAFVDRELPTAFIKIKVNAPSHLDRDATAALLLFGILSEELGEEIRTRRSLSYAVHAMTMQYSVGIGAISVSTSKPKETLEALDTVISHIKAKNHSNDELEEHKHIFATEHYLTEETHGSLAAALAQSFFYFGDATKHYDLATELAKVTPEDVQRLARQILINPRIGVLFGRAQFEDRWAQDLIKKWSVEEGIPDPSTSPSSP